LNIAEIELAVLAGQCLDRRLPDIETMRQEVAGWERDLSCVGWGGESGAIVGAPPHSL
jgi:hypothetical protein